jgi:hypothetical protein
MTITYLVWQAERVKTMAEQLEIEQAIGRVAAALARPWFHIGAQAEISCDA